MSLMLYIEISFQEIANGNREQFKSLERFRTSWFKDGLKDLVEIFYVIAGGKEQMHKKPFIMFYTEPISALWF